PVGRESHCAWKDSSGKVISRGGSDRRNDSRSKSSLSCGRRLGGKGSVDGWAGSGRYSGNPLYDRAKEASGTADSVYQSSHGIGNQSAGLERNAASNYGIVASAAQNCARRDRRFHGSEHDRRGPDVHTINYNNDAIAWKYCRDFSRCWRHRNYEYY